MQPHTVTLADGHVISDDRDRLDMGFVHAALATAYWTKDVTPALRERSWAHCLAIGVYAPAGPQVGCARVLTDFAFRAHLADVMIAPGSRGIGLGKALVRMLLAHPELAAVGAWTLTTQDAHGLYAQFGFQPGEADGKWMTLQRSLA